MTLALIEAVLGVVAYTMVGCAIIGLIEESDANKHWVEDFSVLIWPLLVPIGFAIFVLNRVRRWKKE